MIINIDIEDNLVNELEEMAIENGKSKESILEEIVKSWLKENKKSKNNKWSEEFLNFNGIEDGITFESYRDDFADYKKREEINSDREESENNFDREKIKSPSEENDNSLWLETLNQLRELKEDITFESYRDDLIPPSSEGIF